MQPPRYCEINQPFASSFLQLSLHLLFLLFVRVMLVVSHHTPMKAKAFNPHPPAPILRPSLLLAPLYSPPPSHPPHLRRFVGGARLVHVVNSWWRATVSDCMS